MRLQGEFHGSEKAGPEIETRMAAQCLASAVNRRWRSCSEERVRLLFAPSGAFRT
jgi:hypothetical protein